MEATYPPGPEPITTMSASCVVEYFRYKIFVKAPVRHLTACGCKIQNTVKNRTIFNNPVHYTLLMTSVSHVDKKTEICICVGYIT